MEALDALSDESLGAVLDAGDATTLASVLDIKRDEAEAVMKAFDSYDQVAADEAARARAKFRTSSAVRPPASANEEPSVWRGWPLRFATPLAAAAVLVVAILGQQGPRFEEVPRYRVHAKAMTVMRTKGIAEDRTRLRWREQGTFIHVEFVPVEMARPDVTAQAFLREGGDTLIALPFEVETEEGRLKVMGEVGKTSRVPIGRYELLIVLTPKDAPLSADEAQALERGADSVKGRRLFWYDVDVVPTPAE